MNQLESTMNTICEAIDQTEVSYRNDGDGASVEFGYRSKSGRFSVLVAARKRPHLVLIIIRMPLVVPEDKRLAMAEAVVRANDGVLLGRFDLNLSTGDLNHVTTIPLGDLELSDTLFEEVLVVGLTRAGEYHTAFGRLLFDHDLTSAEAIAEVEMARNA